jgi:predicted acylesterase/phospholipase RssA
VSNDELNEFYGAIAERASQKREEVTPDHLSRDANLAGEKAASLDVPAPSAFVKLREEGEIKQLRRVRKWQYFAGRVLSVLEASDGKEKSKDDGKELHEVLKKNWDGYPAKQLEYDQVRCGDLKLKREIVCKLVGDLLEDKLSAAMYEPIRDKAKYTKSPLSEGVRTGLAFSGGGIRSATFNLGILQGLARDGLLPCFDYLSTVSGGGYIGSWLVAWLKRKGFATVNPQLSPDWNEHDQEEPSELEFLRSYSNYLTPRLGLLSADTWSLVATWVRNLLLNLTILVLLTAAVLLLPRLIVSLSHWNHPNWYLAFVLGLMLLALVYTGRNLELFGRRPRLFPRFSQQGAIQGTIVVPTVLASWLGSCWLWNEGRKLVCHPRAWAIWMLLGAALTFLVWLVAWLLSLKKSPVEASDQSGERPKSLTWFPLVLFSLLEGAVGGLVLFALASLFRRLCNAAYPGNNVHFVAWGTGLVAAIFGLMVALQIGLMGTDFPDERREWWSRVSAWVTIYSLAWVSLFGLALYGPLIVTWAGKWVNWGAALVWLAHTITGAAGARSAKTGGPGPNNATGIVLKAAPLVFVVGLLVLLSFCIYRILPRENVTAHHEAVSVTMDLNLSQDSGDKSTAVTASVNSTSGNDKVSYHDLAMAYWRSSVKTDRRTGLWIFGIALLCTSLAFLLSCRVDINEFSMHLLYRNRLVRCYLGASHQAEAPPAAEGGGEAAEDERNPNPFTGFDPADDILLADLAQNAARPKGKGGNTGSYVGPYPILNATLNVTHGKCLAWQERKAESFSFTPLFCGFDVKPVQKPHVQGMEKEPLEPSGYRPTWNYLYPDEGPYLGTAMGISGAAASPNMGYHSSSALAFLMTLFDIRLGWWAGNPRRKASRKYEDPPWKRRGPGLGILYLLLELFGSTDDERGYVYLSDGGHFENLGIYELVRRECRLIVACDASADEKYRFQDLGNAIRKCRIDHGVDIDLPLQSLQPKAERKGHGKWSPLHWAVGVIHYEKLDASKKPGLLIYLKASLTGNEPADVLEYKNGHPAFPHDTTANQFFTESQFESYRMLGEHIVQKCKERNLLDLVCDPSTWECMDADGLRNKVVEEYNKRP